MTDGIRLDHLVSVRGRFARSVRLDRDAGDLDQLEGYLPTGRSLEVIRRLVQAMVNPHGARAFSITGPYGSGKSSLALFIDALLGHADRDSYQSALRLLTEYDGETANRIDDARRALGAGPSGFVRAVVTAPQREPITTTVLRALERGARRSRVSKKVRSEISEALRRAESDRFASPSYKEVRRLLEKLTCSGGRKPVLLIIDEFGKNLEAYAEGGREGDLYLLQELAEWATGSQGLPLVLVTIQHLAFEAYAAEATTAQRREWAKVQGRFEDIPFVDSPSSTRSLIATALEHSEDADYTQRRRDVAKHEAAAAEQHGLPTVADADLISACYPLHPSTLAVLPDLCSRYGQNERTLFSFLASDEPRSVTSFTRELHIDGEFPWVRLDRVYDYFVESASTFVGVSRDASRWIEVETTIRDAHGLDDAQRRVLKTVGVLNLVATSGALRASPDLLAHALVDGAPGTASRDEIETRLHELEELGLVVFRDFASEYRVWRGSDFDIAGTMRIARRQVRQRSIADLLEEVQPMPPVVAARHTIQTGTTRAFARVYADRAASLPDLDRRDDRADKPSFEKLHGTDGLLIHVVDSEGELPSLRLPSNGLPVVTIVPRNPKPLIDAAVEVAALLQVAEDPDLSAEDRAANRELVERIAYARQVLDQRVSETFADAATWTWHNAVSPKNGKQLRAPLVLEGSGSALLSDVLDVVFRKSPPVPYDTINRTELTSQGAKARRIVLEAALSPSRRRQERLGLDGEGADVATYRAVFEDSGIHAADEGIQPPTHPDWKPVWSALIAVLESATEAPVSIEHVLRQLEAPPYGLKHGAATMLLTAALIVEAPHIAVYEHGTFRPRLDAPLSERMVRNPENFAVKHLAAGRGSKRRQAVTALAEAIARVLPDQPTVIQARTNPTVLTVTLALIDVMHRRNDDFTHKTKEFHSLWNGSVKAGDVETVRSVRDALLESHEPDELLFSLLPEATGFGPLPASGQGADIMTEREIPTFAGRVAESARVIDEVAGALAEHVLEVMVESADSKTLEEVIIKASYLEDVAVLAPPVRRFANIAKMKGQYPDDAGWLNAVTEAVCGGAIKHWNDRSARENLLILREAVTDYARVADLAKFAAGKDAGVFRAFQLHATSQSGRSEKDVVTVQTAEESAIADVLDEAISGLAKRLRSDERSVAESLLAVLIDRFIGGEHGRTTTDGTATRDGETRIVP